MQRNSDKISLIHRSTFEKIQNNNNATSSNKPRIRNSKYKKTHQGIQFSLFDLIKVKRKKPAGPRRQRRAKRIVDKRFNGPSIKPYGKIPVGGKKRQYTRLKKCILRYRLKKRKEEVAHAQQLEMLSKMMQDMSLQIHSRRFRDYCDNCTTAHLRTLTELILRDLDRFQKRAISQNAIKAHAHRRFVVGFRETINFLNINKVKCVIIAPDCEPAPGDAGLDETIASIKQKCKKAVPEVPYVFSLRRRQLSYALFKKVPISCVAILDYDGCNAIFAQLVNALMDARTEYRNLYNTNNQHCINP